MSASAPAPAHTEITVNPEQELYVIKTIHGYSCHGFDRVEKLLSKLAAEGHAPSTPPAPKGTTERYAQYQEAVEKARQHHVATGEKSRAELTPELIGYEGMRVEITHRWTPEHKPETKRFIVGKSTGWMPVHLEIANIRSTGGEAVAAGEILKVRVINSNPHR